MKVLYITSEARPFAASGGLADVAGSLPRELRRRLCGCRVVMPLYASVPEELRANMRFITSLSVPVSWRRQYCGVFEAKHEGVTYYLLDNQYYFRREGLYGHYDDAERFAFLSRAALEMLPHIGFKPDVLHANDWQSALVPIYHSLFYVHDPFYCDMKTVFTIHNVQYQGQFGQELLGDVFGIPQDSLNVVEWNGSINLMKGAIEAAHTVTTVSPTYAKELMDPWFAHGMDPMLRAREWKLSGILNGIDTVMYDPENDPLLAKNFSADDVSGKAQCKAALQQEVGLPVREDVPLVAMVSRLVGHKGFDLVREVIDSLLDENDMQVVLLGSGEWQYEDFFRQAQARHPDKLAYIGGFLPDLARRIYAGADIFLMPSQSEPCGLAQMVACRYGTLPVVRATGGLKDSIQDVADGDGNGFVFGKYDAEEMRQTIERALGAYHNKHDWPILVERALRCDFSWGRSAAEYMKLYRTLTKAE